MASVLCQDQVWIKTLQLKVKLLAEKEHHVMG